MTPFLLSLPFNQSICFYEFHSKFQHLKLFCCDSKNKKKKKSEWYIIHFKEILSTSPSTYRNHMYLIGRMNWVCWDAKLSLLFLLFLVSSKIKRLLSCVHWPSINFSSNFHYTTVMSAWIKAHNCTVRPIIFHNKISVYLVQSSNLLGIEWSIFKA